MPEVPLMFMLKLTEPQLFALELLLEGGVNSESKFVRSYAAVLKKVRLSRERWFAARDMLADMQGENGNG